MRDKQLPSSRSPSYIGNPGPDGSEPAIIRDRQNFTFPSTFPAVTCLGPGFFLVPPPPAGSEKVQQDEPANIPGMIGRRHPSSPMERKILGLTRWLLVAVDAKHVLVVEQKVTDPRSDL